MAVRPGNLEERQAAEPGLHAPRRRRTGPTARASASSAARTTRTSYRSTPKPGSPIRPFGNGGQVDVIEGLPYAERMRNYAINSTPVVVGERHHRRVEHHRWTAGEGAAARRRLRLRRRGPARSCGRFTRCRRKANSATTRWEDGSAEYTGNTNVWSMITVDEELGYVYLPFGTPTNDYYGGHRPGNNLFAESLVCLDATTGKRVWHFQARASRPVGLRLSGGADSRRHHRRRTPHQGRRAGQQTGRSSTSSIA